MLQNGLAEAKKSRENIHNPPTRKVWSNGVKPYNQNLQKSKSSNSVALFHMLEFEAIKRRRRVTVWGLAEPKKSIQSPIRGRKLKTKLRLKNFVLSFLPGVVTSYFSNIKRSFNSTTTNIHLSRPPCHYFLRVRKRHEEAFC